MNKQQIARSFGNAVASYDRAARLQRFVGKQLLEFLPVQNTGCVVDLGAGTGFFSRVLSPHVGRLVAVDLSDRMVEHLRRLSLSNCEVIQAAAEHLPLADNSVDAIYSNLMMQWCADPVVVMKEGRRVLRPGGCMVFSTLLQGTLFELQKAWQRVDGYQHVNRFVSVEELDACCQQADYADYRIVMEEVVLDYADVYQLARELKGLGANLVAGHRPRGLMGRGKWNRLNAAYERFRQDDGQLPATYIVAYVGLYK